MIRAVAIALALAALSCAQRPPKTWASMRRWRLTHSWCDRACPVGKPIPILPEPRDATIAQIKADCCYDIDGITWGSCAWDAWGTGMTVRQLLDPTRGLGGCGDGPGYPDCGNPAVISVGAP